MVDQQAVEHRVAELEASFAQWQFRRKLKDGYWLASILKAWKA